MTKATKQARVSPISGTGGVVPPKEKRFPYDGRSKEPEYRVWKSMLSRCRVKSDSAYYKYGARGVTVCDEWSGIGGYSMFISDMGRKKDGESIDRIDPNGNYTPENCRWADTETQANNKRSTTKIEAFGKVMSTSQWARETGINRKTISERIFKLGWDVEKALTLKPYLGRNGHDK